MMLINFYGGESKAKKALAAAKDMSLTCITAPDEWNEGNDVVSYGKS